MMVLVVSLSKKSFKREATYLAFGRSHGSCFHDDAISAFKFLGLNLAGHPVTLGNL